jgi:1-acyl-sn-glycerol-3-phosphate acyltransferase
LESTWKNEFAGIVDGGEHLLPPVRTSAPEESFPRFIEFLRDPELDVRGLSPEAQRAIEAELRASACPAAVGWFRKLVAGIAKEDGPEGARIADATIARAADVHAFKIVARLFQRSEREHRPLSAEESREITGLLTRAAELRHALGQDHGARDHTRLLEAAKDPEFLRELFREHALHSAIELRASPSEPLRKPDAAMLERAFHVLDSLAGYHAYEVHGLENIPKSGRCIVAFNHSLATYDIALFAEKVAQERGRNLRMLGDHLIFKIPGLCELATRCGMVEGRPELAKKLVDTEQLVGVAPGGMMEALRPSSKAHEIMWDRRKGFAKMALDSGAPVVLAACPAADEIYHVYSNPLTDAAYSLARVPVPIATGAYGTPIPKPVKLEHRLSRPIYPPPLPRRDAKPGDTDYDAVLDGFHRQLVEQMEALMKPDADAAQSVDGASGTKPGPV